MLDGGGENLVLKKKTSFIASSTKTTKEKNLE